MGDQVFFQGHAAPGIYARAFLEGRLSEDQLDHFRQEVVPGQGLSSYPHPRLMPDFWEFPTVSMGLGPLSAIYQARFNRYLHNRGIKDTSGNRVWAFLGDGETDEPESLGALSIAAREGLDNLTFVVNCNLQRLDGPVRGNGKIVQELESRLPGRRLERDQGHLGPRVGRRCWPGTSTASWSSAWARCSTASRRSTRSRSGAYIREHFFGADPRLLALVEDLTRRPDQGAPPRRARPSQAVCRVPRGGRAHGPAHRGPGPDRQGLDARPRRRGTQHHPPGQEAQRAGAAHLPRPAGAAHPRSSSSRRRPTTTRARLAGDAATSASVAPRSAVHRRAGWSSASRWTCRRSRSSAASTPAPGPRRPRPRWPSRA